MTDDVPGSPVRWCEPLGRRLRQDGLDTLGTSTQTLAAQAFSSGDADLGRDLAAYFLFEIRTIYEALLTWAREIVAHRLELDGLASGTSTADALMPGLKGFSAGSGDLAAVLASQYDDAIRRLEVMRVREAGLHDALVFWIQEMLTALARDHGDQAVADCVVRTYDQLWAPRYAWWDTAPPMVRLQVSVEGMRGHLSGTGRRGDVALADEGDRLVMSLDPCGSCGILRRGDPESGRIPSRPAGTTLAHDWAWGRIGLGWYASHSAIVMQHLGISRGGPPMRPLEGCDLDGPCRWYIYKDPARTRAEHYASMGFAGPH